jgi:hypothetical protein
VLDLNTGEPFNASGEPADVMHTVPPYYLSKSEKQIHSCQKPLLLLSMLVMLNTKEGDTVLDPFMGSGSCGVACALTGRNFIGLEKEKEVFDKAVEWSQNVNWTAASDYIKTHLSSSEKGFRFGFQNRKIQKK